MKVPAFILAATIAAAMASTATTGPAVAVRTPVLLELFTSEGCSSCPPADQLLENLDRQQPVLGAELVVLSEHVDYWNHLGWSDPYSLPLFSTRQQTYDQRLSTTEVYTPQLVIDGAIETLGSDRTAVLKAVARSLRRPKTMLAVSATKLSNEAMIHVSAPASGRLTDKGTLSIILAMDSARSSVTRGENKGRSLNHVAVAYSVLTVREVSSDAGISRDVKVSPKPGAPSGATRVIAVLQDKNGEVEGVSQTRF
jgi:hypothetical protein